MPYDAKAIANHFLSLAEKDHKELNPMKIQKLVYFAHGWHLAITGQPLITDQVEAWAYGPVIPSLYHEFKEFGSGKIQREATDLRAIRDAKGATKYRWFTPSIEDYQDEKANETTRQLLDRIWEVYGPFSAIQLSNMTHEDNSPWDVTWKECQGRKGTDIRDELIREKFREMANQPT